MQDIWALVVEADPVNLLIITNVLKEQGVHFKRNTTGVNVLGQAQAMSPQPDFILVSARVPGGALAILGQLRADKRLRTIPVIAITDDNSPALSEAGGFAAVVFKAQLRKELSAAMRQLLSDDDEETHPARPDKPAFPTRGN